MKLKNVLSLVLSLILMAQLCLPVGAVAAEPLVPLAPALGAPKAEPAQPTAGDNPIDISGADRYIVITNTGYTIGTAETETAHTGAYVLTGGTTSTTAPSGNHISVKTSGADIAITLNSVNIRFSDDKKCPFSIDGDMNHVNLTLAGESVLTGGKQSPGLRVETGKSLTITVGSTGSLTAVGGFDGGAGIGGGNGCTSGNIDINGGVVTASSRSYGTSIGGGNQGASGNIVIRGGIVTASDGIGKGNGGSNAGSFSTGANGGAVIFAGYISDKSQRDSWRGIIFESLSNRDAIYGSGTFILPGDVTIPRQRSLTMKAGQTLTVPKDTTLTVEGHIYQNGGKVGGDGSIVNPENIWLANPTYIYDTNILIGDHPEGGTDCHPCKGHVISGHATNCHVLVSGGEHDIELRDAYIQNPQGTGAFVLSSGATVNLTLAGYNMLRGDTNCAGLAVQSGNTLTITEKSTGTLDASGGAYGAGIGGGNGEAGGTITIKGGTVNTTGGACGAGIGGGYYGAGGTITITGGTVNATGGKDENNLFSGGAGIGGGSGGAGGIINIKSGVVTATGGNSAVPPFGGAGIGSKVDGGKGSFFANGDAAIFASSITDTSGYDNNTWRGMIFIGGAGDIYGTSFTLPCDVSIPLGSALYMTEDQTLTVPRGTTLTVDGFIYQNGGTVDGAGSIRYQGNILPVIPNDISTGSVIIMPCNGTCKGHIITGKTDKNTVSVIGGEHNIMLLNTFIRSDTCAFSLFSGAKVNLTLRDFNKLISGMNYAGLAVREGATLTITGGGTLSTDGGKYGAGIGGDYAGGSVQQTGIINIESGEVIAEGGSEAAGIGGGYYGSGGNITINGGRVKAKSDALGAGIGGGYCGAGGTITINGDSRVTATGGDYGAGIGGGSYGAGGNITLNNGTVNTVGRIGGAGIGGGYAAAGGTITISGGRVESCMSVCNGAGIGSGESASSGNTTINISGGYVNSEGGTDGAGIGGGNGVGAGDITISGGTVIAKGDSSTGGGAAGIGGGNKGTGGTVTITGGTITANGAKYGAGIGIGHQSKNITISISGGTVNAKGGWLGGAGIGSGNWCYGGDCVTISGGTVIAEGGGNTTYPEDAAGIGSGWQSTGGLVNITGGTVTATSVNYAAGIGGGRYNVGGTVIIDGDVVVFATKGAKAPNYIGNGEGGTGSTVIINRGIVFQGDTGTFHGSGVSMKADATLPSGKNLTIPSGKTLTIPSGKTLTNAATLFLDGGTIDGGGKICDTGNGTSKASIVSGDIAPIPDQVYTGKEVTPPVTVNPTREILGNRFTVVTDGFSRSYQNNTNIGETAKVRYTRPGYPTAEKGFHIVKSGTDFDGGVKTYNAGGTETTRFTYGETITVKAKPKATGTVATTLALTEPKADQMALYLGGVQISDAVDPDSSGVYTMTYDTTGKKLALAYNTITAKYVGNGTMADAAGDVSVTLLPKPLTAKALNSHSRVYDGSRDFVNVPLVLTGVLGQDTVTATANGTTANTDAGTPAFTASSITFGGENADYYTLAPADVSGNVSITPKPVTVTVTAQNKVYDGTTTAPVTYVVIGKVGTDDVTATGTANFANKTVGIGKTVTVDSIGLSGTKEDNYSLTPPGTITTAAAITKRTIAWDKAGTVTSRFYDTTKTATVATAPTLIGVVERDAVTVTNGTVTFANANAGTHAITAMGFGIEGTDKDNYIAPAGQPTFAKGTITAKTVKTPTISIATFHTFNGKQQIPIFTVKDGATDGATVIPATDYTVTYGTNVNAGTDAGSVTVNLKGNYSGNAIAKFTIQKANGPSATTKPILMKAGAEIAYSIPLPAISNAGTVTYTVAPITNSIFSVSPHVNQTDKTLEFTSASGATSGQTSTVEITIASQNYETFIVKQTFTVADKTTVAITGLKAADRLTYNGQPQKGYDGKLVVTGATLAENNLIYTYTGISGTAYSSQSAPTNAGSYMLTIEVNHASYTGSHAVITFTIAPQNLTVTLGNYKVTKVWDGNTTVKATGSLSVNGGVPSETIKATPRDYPSSDVGNSHSVTVDLALTDTSGNYTLANNTVEVTGTITKSAVLPAKPAAPALAAANAVSVRLQTVTVEGETVEYAKNTADAAPDTGWQTSTDFGRLTPNTKYFFFARVKENTNHPAGTASSGTAITTEKKKSPTIAPKGMVFAVGKAWESDFTVKQLLGEWEHITGTPLPGDAKFSSFTGPVGDERKVLASIEIKDTPNKLIFTSKNNATVPDREDVFYITVSFDKYQDVTFPLTFSNREKHSATISATVASKKYDGKAVEQPTPTATSGGSPAILNYTYQWQKDDGSAISELPKDVGNYALVITGENDTSRGSLTISFMIVKRNLTVTATNAEIKSGDAAPTYTFTKSGLAENETLDGVKATCGYKNDGSASSSAGNYPITVSGGTVSGGGNGNYTITYDPGTLSVTLDTTALDTAITAAKTAKSGVTVSDQDPSQVTNGTRFVTTAAMDALDAALAGATASKAGATTNGQIANATDALTDATTAFNHAIQTGTYNPGGGGGNPAPQPKPEEPKPEIPSADKFSDIKGHWAEESIKFVIAEGLFNGVSDTDFAPDKNTTRSMLVTVLYRRAGTPATEAGGSAWYSSAQAWAMQSGISDGTNMESEMTRQELVTMLYRFAKQIGIDVSVGEDTNILSYNDAFDLPQWSIPAFQWACGAGIVEGVGENLLPTHTATRAQVATMLQRFLTLATK